jgi:hypothetical protein
MVLNDFQRGKLPYFVSPATQVNITHFRQKLVSLKTTLTLVFSVKAVDGNTGIFTVYATLCLPGSLIQYFSHFSNTVFLAIARIKQVRLTRLWPEYHHWRKVL